MGSRLRFVERPYYNMICPHVVYLPLRRTHRRPLNGGRHSQTHRGHSPARGRGGGPSRGGGAVVGHMGLDEVAGGESAAQGQLTGKHSRRHDTGQALRVLSGGSRVGSADTEHVEHGALGLQDSTATNGAHFDRRHGHGYLEGSPQAVANVSKMRPQGNRNLQLTSS